MHLIPLFAALLILFHSEGPALAAGEVTERAVPNPPSVMQQMPRVGTSPQASMQAPTTDQQLAALQQQVQALQAQVAALQSVLVVTPTGATLQALNLTVSSPQGVVIQSQKNVAITAGMTMNFQSGTSLSMKGNTIATVEGAGGLNLRGATVKLNNGSKPMATLGSAVAGGKVVSGSATILGD